MTRGDDEGLLGRWSRRKLAPEPEPEPKAAPPDPVPVPDSVAAPQDAMSESELLDKLGLKDPDEMGEGDDFAAFLKAEIPQALKKRALRRLWLSNPALANLDGLLDYGEDYTDAAMVPEVLNTIYRVGKGMLPDKVEDEDAEDPLVAAEDTEDVDEPQQETNGINQASSSVRPPDPDVDLTIAPRVEDDMNSDPQAADFEPEIEIPRPRRMAFRTE